MEAKRKNQFSGKAHVSMALGSFLFINEPIWVLVKGRDDGITFALI